MSEPFIYDFIATSAIGWFRSPPIFASLAPRGTFRILHQLVTIRFRFVFAFTYRTMTILLLKLDWLEFCPLPQWLGFDHKAFWLFLQLGRFWILGFLRVVIVLAYFGRLCGRFGSTRLSSFSRYRLSILEELRLHLVSYAPTVVERSIVLQLDVRDVDQRWLIQGRRKLDELADISLLLPPAWVSRHSSAA